MNDGTPGNGSDTDNDNDNEDEDEKHNDKEDADDNENDDDDLQEIVDGVLQIEEKVSPGLVRPAWEKMIKVA